MPTFGCSARGRWGSRTIYRLAERPSLLPNLVCNDRVTAWSLRRYAPGAGGMSAGAGSDVLDHAHCGVGRTRGSSVFKRLLVFLAIATVVLAFDALFVTTAIAASPPGPYFNGFETD